MENLKSKSLKAIIWKLLQNCSSEVINFIVSIVIARMLKPNDYGLIAMVTVFTNIAMVFVNTGFSSSIIQKEKLTEEDKNTLFYSGILVALILYFILFLFSGIISKFYNQSELQNVIRIYGLIIIISSTYSVHQALIQRLMEYNKLFYAGIIGAIIHGIVGIILAKCGMGVWSIVFSSLVHYMITAFIMWIIVKWKPSNKFSFYSLRANLPFSTRVLCSNLINTIFNNIRSLVIGKFYSAKDLAFYNKGYQFPTLVMNQVDGAFSSVMFSTLSKYQNNWNDGLNVLRREIKTVYFICAPILFGIFATADQFVIILLTEKWADSIIFVKLVSILCLLWPLSVLSHALNAIGESKISLVNNILGKTLTIIFLIFTFKVSMSAIVVGSIISSCVSLVFTGLFSQKYLKYDLINIIKDIFPSLILSFVMCITVQMIDFFNFNMYITLVIKILFGVMMYVFLSYLFNKNNLNYCKNIIKKLLHGE